MMRWFWIVTVGGLALGGVGGGCAESAEHAGREAGLDSTVVECPVDGRGETVAVTLKTGPDTALVTLPDRFSPRTRGVARIEEGPGTAYAGDRVVFWNRGPDVRVAVDGDTLRGCAPASVWREARRRGVVFRGIGQEPGWHLEVRADSLRFVGDYGQRTVRVPRSSVTVDRTTDRTVYRADSLDVVIDAEACTDVMSGAFFERTVTVRVEGDTYRGCGRFFQ
jgi:putative lipoprotein